MRKIGGSVMKHKCGCACGAIRFEVRGAPLNAAICHCSQCKKITGSPMFMAPAFKKADVVMERGEPKWFESSDIAKRGFCENCGSSLFFKFNNTDTIDVLIGAFDNPGGIQPTDHLWVSNKLPWLDVDESMPLYQTDRSKKPMNQKD